MAQMVMSTMLNAWYTVAQMSSTKADICYGYNEDTLTIYDVTDKKASKVISRTSVSTLSLSVYMYVADNSSSTRELPTLIKDGSTTRTGKSSSSSTMRLMRRNSPAQLLINTP
mgnify:CR=1 FL=1